MKTKFLIMEQENTIHDPQTEDFNFNKHGLNALMAALYYVVVYIPFILPYHIWGKAATRLSLIWENRSLQYNEKDKAYPLFAFYFIYLVNFLIDAVIFLAWPLGFLMTAKTYMVDAEFSAPVENFLIPLFAIYVSVISFKLMKEVFYFALNNLIVWFFEVIAEIGRFIKHMWRLNFVIKRKD